MFFDKNFKINKELTLSHKKLIPVIQAWCVKQNCSILDIEPEILFMYVNSKNIPVPLKKKILLKLCTSRPNLITCKLNVIKPTLWKMILILNFIKHKRFKVFIKLKTRRFFFAAQTPRTFNYGTANYWSTNCSLQSFKQRKLLSKGLEKLKLMNGGIMLFIVYLWLRQNILSSIAT